MTNTDLNPEQLLENFFLLPPAFAFYDQLKIPGTFSYGRMVPELSVTTSGERISTLHLITSPGGGLATFIAPTLPVDHEALLAYIRGKIAPSEPDIRLEQLNIQQTINLRFINGANGSSYLVPFSEAKAPLTHAESAQLIAAIQGSKNQAYLSAQTRFSVNCQASGMLQADWAQFLRLAFRDDARDTTALTRLINQQIDQGTITLAQSYKNAPEASTQEQVRERLVNLAALMASDTLKGITRIDQIPDKVNYDINYSTSVPQSYLLEYDQDLALAELLPFDQIVSFDPTPLPEPSRPDKPVKRRQCTVGLGFAPKTFNITALELSWGGKTTPMSWPLFAPVTLDGEDTDQEITLKVTFADYTTYSKSLFWQPNITLQTEDIGFCTVEFDARHLADEFDTISGTASWIPSDPRVKKQNFTFAFSKQQWQAVWLVNAHADGLSGRIEYRWQGKTKGIWSKKYDSGLQQSTVSPIELQYHSQA
ncbi:hypothetical protein TUM12370_16220 [Salmonella enterica subsp. enterica serovar Choleraesuis]|nr:hypothetical protein TUM12370_16220 [Salmonella enterica subsp. enterica serovar Choleraesuis]